MIALLSPAKTLDFAPSEVKEHSIPRLLDDSHQLVSILKKQSVADLQQLMGVSEKIANLNVERYQNFETPFSLHNAKQAMLAFKGDVYLGLEAETFNKRDATFAQKHLRILSGLYGLLKPLDLMQAYRLEMGTALKGRHHRNLYEFWNDRITELINADLEATKSKYVINLASKEYFKSIITNQLDRPVIHIHFKELRDGKLKVIAFNAKKARGRMAHLMVKERIKRPNELKTLVVNDYIFDEAQSDQENFTFIKT